MEQALRWSFFILWLTLTTLASYFPAAEDLPSSPESRTRLPTGRDVWGLKPLIENPKIGIGILG